MAIPKNLRKYVEPAKAAKAVKAAAKRSNAKSIRRGHAAGSSRGGGVVDDMADQSSRGRVARAEYRVLEHIQLAAIDAVAGGVVVATIDLLKARAKQLGLKNLTDRDYAVLYVKLHKLSTSRKVLSKAIKFGNDGHQSQISGAIRELVTNHMHGLQAVVDDTIARLCVTHGGKGGLTVVDTAIHAGVEMPAALADGAASLELATDRMVGRLVIKDRPPIPLKSGKKGKEIGMVHVDGVFTPDLLIEIKGGSNADEAIEQLLNIAKRAKEKYIVIGGKCYELDMPDLQSLERLVVAPEMGKKTAAAVRKAQAFKSKMKIRVMPYSRAEEDAIMALTDEAFKIFRAQQARTVPLP